MAAKQSRVNLVPGQLYTPIPDKDFLNSPKPYPYSYTGKLWSGAYNRAGFYVHPGETLIFLNYQRLLSGPNSLVDFATFFHSKTGKIAIFTNSMWVSDCWVTIVRMVPDHDDTY